MTTRVDEQTGTSCPGCGGSLTEEMLRCPSCGRRAKPLRAPRSVGAPAGVGRPVEALTEAGTTRAPADGTVVEAGPVSTKPPFWPPPPGWAADKAATSAPVPAPVPAGSCVVCGREPAARATFTANTGMVILSQWRKVAGPFCRECGLEVYRRQMAHTLAAGWWGFIAFFINLIVILANVRAWRSVSRLPEPTTPAVRSPLRQGQPLWRRPAAWVAPALAVLIVIFVAVGVSDRGASRYAGQCVRFDAGHTKVLAVPCSDSHDGKVIGVAPTKTSCPAGTSVAFRLTVDEDKVLCVDLDQ